MGTMVIWTLRIYRELVLCSGSLVNCPGLSADCRIEPAVWHSNGLLNHSLSSLLYVFLSKLVLMNEEKSDAKILPSLEC